MGFGIVVIDDPVLGICRWCDGCAEPWPADEEFWPPTGLLCRACVADRWEWRRVQLMLAARRYRSRRRRT